MTPAGSTTLPMPDDSHAAGSASAGAPAGGAEAYYFAELAQGRWRLPCCTACGRWHFYPRLLCPHCGADTLAWRAPSGRGTVYSTTTVRGKAGDYNVCLVDLDEGPRLMSRVIGVPPEQVRIGMPVRAAIEAQDGRPLLVFTAAQETV